MSEFFSFVYLSGHFTLCSKCFIYTTAASIMVRGLRRSRTFAFCWQTFLRTSEEVVNDPIHGSIELHPLCVKVIDTPQFQRLRNIKQLGGCYMVYPGAAHNRFEHSIGTCYLAGEMARTLQQKQPELNITDEDILCVEIAGLCHDLGHGPFSHLFDQSFIPAVFKGKGVKRKWQHEDASKEMFHHLIDNNGLRGDFAKCGLNPEDISFIEELIDGKKSEATGRGAEKPFLYEIVANKRNGIDVDKWEYFARDCHGLGIRNNFDHGRLMKFVRVISVEGEQQICYKRKEAANLYEMFHTRMNLHRRAYQHRVNKLIEEMITDALLLADEYITFRGKDGRRVKMSEAIDDMEAYSRMTDCIVQQILVSDDPNLKPSQDILAKIQKRELYKLVGTFRPQGNKEFTKDVILEGILKEDGCSSLKSKDLYVHIVNLDYGRKSENPIDYVWFYSKKNLEEAFHMPKEKVSLMLPGKFSEQIVNLYCKRVDHEAMQEAKQCFDEWCKKNSDSISR